MVAALAPGSAGGLLTLLLLALWPSRTRSACKDHDSCTACIADAWEDFTCLWYVGPYSTYGTCLTGQVGARAAVPDTGDVAVGSYSVWTGYQSYTLYDVDEFSEGSCFVRTQTCETCEFKPECGPGYAEVSNTPYYGEGTSHPEYRNLRCCRQQRNMDGFLAGFEAINGVASGDVYFASCCSDCPLGTENVDCDVTDVNDGECQYCPAGKYNDVDTIGSTCKTCPPCEAGAERACGGTSEGSCVECAEGSTYKEAGLDGGSWSDACGQCEDCPAGYQRTECGPVSAGSCEPCPLGEYYASPNCRECSSCVSFDRMGCALLSDGLCPECDYGKWGSSASSCQVCQGCDGEAVADVAVGALNLSGPMQRAGCGGGADGECVRLAAGLDDWAEVALCPAEHWDQTVCQEARLRVRWALQGLAAEQLGVGGGNCTAEAGLCLTGLWRVLLQRRTASAPSGETVRVLQEWWAPDLAPQDAGSGILAFERELPALDAGLPAGGGYLLRVDLVDRGGSCCSASDASPLSAVTADFALAEPVAAVEAALNSSAVAIALGDREAAVAAAAAGCSAGSLWPAEVACEREKALRLGLAVGQEAVVPAALPTQASSAQAASQEARGPLTEARTALQEWEGLEAGIQGLLPESPEAWAEAAAELGGPGATESVLAAAAAEAASLARAAGGLRDMWLAEVNASLPPLRRALADLELLDALLSSAAIEVDFDHVRAAQAITWRLRQSLLEAPPDGAEDLETWLAGHLHRAGNAALLLVGSWGAAWAAGTLTMAWDIQAGADAPSDATAEGADFGGGVPDASAVPLELTRARLWQPFKEVALDWVERARAARRRLGRRAPSRRVTATAAALAEGVAEALQCVEAVTERLLEPLSRDGSSLLAGPLPDVAGLGFGARCLRNALDLFSEDSAEDDSYLGLGEGKIRPWLDYSAERDRLQKAAAEVSALVRGRLRAFDALLAQLLDAREAAAEPLMAEVAASRAQAAADHLTVLVQDPNGTNGTDASARWHWLDVRGDLLGALGSGRLSVARLVHRRWVKLARLAVWAGASEDTALSSPFGLDDGWASAAQAEVAARSALSGALSAAVASSSQRGTGYLRVEATASSRPLSVSALVAGGSVAVRLRGSGGAAVRMHAEAHAFLVPAAGSGLEPSASAATLEGAFAGVEGNASAEPHVELALRRLVGLAGEPVDTEEPAAFVTRHRRGDCEPLWEDNDVGGLGAALGAALLPLDGVWVASARDGPSQNLLTIAGDTTLRLLLRVDIPAGDAPWQLLDGLSDTLYELPASGECSGLQALFELDPTPAPTFQPLPTSTSTTSSTTTTVTTSTSTTTRTTFAFWVPQSNAATREEASAEEESTSLLLYVGGFVGCLLACAVCGLGCMQALKLHYRRQAKRGTVAPAPEPEEGRAAPAHRAAGPAAAGLRQRTPSPTNVQEPWAGPLRRAAADAATAPPLAPAPPPPATGPATRAAPEPPAPPNLQLESLSPQQGAPRASGGGPGATASSARAESWDGSNTPPDSSRSSSSSGSSSSSSSGSSGAPSLEEVPEPPPAAPRSSKDGPTASAADSTCAGSSRVGTPKGPHAGPSEP